MMNSLRLYTAKAARWFAVILFSIYASGAQAQKASGFSFYAPPQFPAEVLSDCIRLLEQSTGQRWQVSGDPKAVSKGFLLTLAEDGSFTAKESFRIRSNGSSLLQISSTSAEGLVFGLYKHLRGLGFKFYLPDELYTLVPSVSNPFGPEKNTVDKPFLQVRDFFGTGGFGSGNSDPDGSVQKDWRLWKLRNGFGAAFQLAGHRGENFILENKEQLRKHPEWLVTPLTGNDATDRGIKLNYLNKNAVDFFTDWSIEPFTRKTYQLPPPNTSDFVSVEPSDAGGYLNELPANAGRKLPSVSDQVFAAANLAAEKLDRLFPNHSNIGVSLYAYSSHAEPPSFRLHPRVFVQLIPYQFQSVAFGPSFVKLWSEKTKRFGLYDYLNYTDAQYDLPGGLTLEEAMKRLQQSVKAGSEGISYETSFSKFSTGIPLWVIGRYLSDGDAAWEKNLKTLTRDLFQNAGAPIGKLFEKFYTRPFAVNEMGSAVSLVEKAYGQNNDRTVEKRLSELEQYLHYIHLVYRSRDLKTGSMRDRMLPLAEFAWKAYESKIIHSYRIMQLASYAFLNIDRSDPGYASYQKLHQEWFPETPPAQSAWARIRQLQPGRTDNYLSTLKKTYAPAADRKEVSWSDILKQDNNRLKPASSVVFGGSNLTRGYFGIYADKPTEVKVRYRLTGNAEKKITISGLDNNYQSPLAFTADQPEGEIKFTAPAGETTFFINSSPGTSYRIQVKLDRGYFFFDGAPRGLMAFYKEFDDPYESYTYDPRYYPSYVFVPADVSTIQYRVQLNALAITSPGGKKTATNLLSSENGGFENRSFRVEAAEWGKLWKVVISGNYDYSFLNIPNRYYLLAEKN